MGSASNPWLLAPASLLLAGCGLDVVGTWQLARLSVDDVLVEEAGFVDIRSNGDVSSGVPNVALFRYWWAPEAGAWEPDPTPFVQSMSFDLFAFQDDPGEASLTVEMPVGANAFERATFYPENPRAGRWELSDPEWPHGELLLELER